MSKWIVYISSTFKDLKEFRSELINLFQNQLKNNFELNEIMERMYDDGTYTPFVNDCVEAVKNCDIYIIIQGNRTGSSPPNEDRTYTEIELDTALENEKKIFCLRLETFDETEIDNKAKHQELLDKFKGRPIHNFKDVLTLKNALYECLFRFTSQSPINKKNPYKGLAAFDVEDGDYFFGRNQEVESCLKMIISKKEHPFFLVIGNSGTGKSSFVQAGILYKLKHKKELGFSDRNQIIVKPGNEPFTNLTYQLQLQGFSVEDVLKGNSGSAGLILFFDQFEEVITQCYSTEAQAERKQLFEFLDTLVSNKNLNSNILVITAFRSDFLSQLANYDFIETRQSYFPLKSLDFSDHIENWEQSIKEIISKPALKNGVRIEKELVDQLVSQIKDIDGSLPILQFSLEQIWNKQTIKDRLINSSEYNKLSQGKGMAGIIEIHAEKVITRITKNGKDKEKEAILKSIFINLVEVTENLSDVKKTVTKDELLKRLKEYPEQMVTEVFETLVSEKSRLLTVNKDKDKSVNVNIIHEVLIRKWERLKAWIDERREALQYKKKLTLDIAAFKKGGENLYGIKKLKRANAWKIINPDLTTDDINSFLLKSKKNNNRRLYKIFVLALSVIALIIVLIYYVQPAIQKKHFENLLENNYPNLYNEVKEVDGIELPKTIKVDGFNSAFLSDNIKFIKNISSLEIGETKLKDLLFLREIISPDSLDSLYIWGNTSLTSLEGIETLQSLKSLTILNSRIKSLEGIETLHSLNSLTILDNSNLTSLEGIGELPALNSLTISGTLLSNLKEIEGLKSLDSLTIKGNRLLTSLEGIEKLTNLHELVISNNPKLPRLEGIENLTSLNTLLIEKNDIMTSLEGIGELPALNSLTIYENDRFTSLSGIEKLPNLQELNISFNVSLESLEGIENLKTLNYLSIGWTRNLTSLRRIKKLTNLQELVISDNANLESIEGIENLTSLNYLSIKGNDNLTSLAGIEKRTNLQELVISNNASLESFQGIENLTSLNYLSIEGHYYLTNLEGIENLTALNYLNISNNYRLASLEGIEKLTNLQELVIATNTSLKSLEGIENLPSLNYLSIYKNDNLTSLAGIEKLTNLQELDILNNPSLESLEGIENLPSLYYLSIEENSNLTSLEGIGELPALSSLNILKNYRLTSLAGIEKLTNLQELVISNNVYLESLEGIENLTSLNYLSIEGTYYLTSLKGIGKLPFLNSINIANNERLTSLAGIEKQTNLQELDISYNTDLKNLAGIENLFSLKFLAIKGNDNLTSLGVIEKLDSLRVFSIETLMPDVNNEVLYELSELEELRISTDPKIDIKRIKKKNPGIKIEFVDY